MINALGRFAKLVRSFNRRKLTERDFYKICALFNITILWANIPVLQGFHINYYGDITITLDKNLKGAHLVYTAFHELAHALLHTSPDAIQINFFHQFESREENEAEAVALIALFPTNSLNLLDELEQEGDEFQNTLIKKRRDLKKQVTF